MSLLFRVGWPYRPWVVGAFLLAFLPLGAFAQPPAPPPPVNFFTDQTGIVPKDVAATIEQRLGDLQKASSNQVLVVVSDRLPDGYASLEEYTNRTAEAWRVGDKSRDNGAVLFVFVGDRKVRIEVGYGLEGALPDALASRIINDEITPRFREGKYGEGLLAGVDAIILATKGEYQPKSASSPPAPSSRLWEVLWVLAFFYLLHKIRESRGSRTYSRDGSSRTGSRGSWGSSGGSWSGGGSSRGGGGGGGFSGGGGSFGGGGASGSW